MGRALDDPHDSGPLGAFPATGLSTQGGALEDLLGSVSCTVRLAGAYRFAGAWNVPMRVTPHHILCIGVSGAADVVVGNECYRLACNTLVLTPPHIPQSFTKVSESDLCFYTVHFSATVYGVLDFPSLYGLAPVLQAPAERVAAFSALAARIVDELAAAQPGHTLAANAECGRMLALLWRETVALGGGVAREDVSSATALAQLAPVFRAIQVHHAETLRVRDLAQLVSLHPAWFSTRFKQLTGLAPARYLLRYRLERVREFLLSSDRPIHEIAALTGFQDPLYLSRQFRRLVGASPTAYRQAAGLAARLPEP